MMKALNVYATRSGETKQIADYIAEGLRIAGKEVSVASANGIKKETNLHGYDALVFGSAT